MGCLVMMDLKVSKEDQDLLVPLVKWGQEVLWDREVPLDQLGNLVCLGRKVRLDLKEIRGPLVLMALPVPLDHKVQRGHLDPLDAWGLLVFLVLRENLDCLDYLAQLVHLALPELLANLVLRVKLAPLVHKELMVILDLAVSRVIEEPEVSLVKKETSVLWDLMVTKVTWVTKAIKEEKVKADPWGLKELKDKRESMDQGEKQDHQAHLERRAVSVFLVSLAILDLLVKRQREVLQVDEAREDQKERLVFLDL